MQPRFWRAFARPLNNETDGLRQLVVVLRDETDARRTERMRADFLANASHELRTPLASLAGFVETLRTHARDDTEAREKFLGIMAQQASRMARLGHASGEGAIRGRNAGDRFGGVLRLCGRCLA